MKRRNGRISTKDLDISFDNVLPAGVVIAYAGTTAPSGWLLCDGSAISRTTYSRLFAVINETHGQGDNATTFNIPDYRGRFLRGVANGQTTDPDRASRTAMATGGNTGDNVGSIQGQAFQTHDHPSSTSSIESANHYHEGSGTRQSSNASGVAYSFDAVTGTNGTVVTPDTGTQSSNHTHSITIPNRAASGTHSQASTTETRPVNAAVNFIIKV